MNNVLVTGATGFIGKHLVTTLLNKKINVRTLSRHPQKSSDHLVNTVQADLTQAESLAGICSGIDTVFHLGGYAHAWEEANTAFANQHHAINFLGTQNILEEAKRAGVKRFIFFSSVKAVADSELSIDESWDHFPQSPYGIAKRKAEELVLAEQKTMHVCVLRPALVYGPGWKGNLASMLRAIERGLFPPLPDSKNSRSMVSINDICHAAELASMNSQANGKTYFVTDGVHYSTHQLYVLMRQSLGKSIPQWHIPLAIFKIIAILGDFGKKTLRRRMPFDSSAMSKLFGSAHYQSTRIESELGFKPAYDLKKLLPIIIAQHKNP